MPHGTIRATTLKTVIPHIMERFGCGENVALKMFYESHTGKCYADDNTGLYGQSAIHVFSLFCEEKAETIEETPHSLIPDP
jgi:hypothetical protein